MSSILALLFLLFAIVLILGLIKPSIVIFWGSKTRKQVLLVYGLCLLAIFIIIGITADDKSSNNKNEENAETTKGPISILRAGSIIYEVECTGTNQEGIDLFKAFSPTKINIYFSDDKFRMIENGGLSGNIMSDASIGQFYALDSTALTAKLATFVDMEKTMEDETMRKAMPTHYRAGLKETKETAVICGIKCKKYEVKSSGFVKAYAKASVWITNELIVKQMRYCFETQTSKFLAPLPLQIGIDGGTALKMEVVENDVEVTFTVTSFSMEKPDDKWFVLPTDYQIEE